MSGRTTSLVMGVLLVLAFATGWAVSGWHADAGIARVELAQSSQELLHAQQCCQRHHQNPQRIH